MDARNRENFLIHVMNNGFQRAAASFSQLVNRPVKTGESHTIHHTDGFAAIYPEQGDLYILVTQVIGDISGKSFLIFNRDESQEMFKTLNTLVSNDSLKEAFLLEIDNIISASVIAELSNALDLEIYGDVPHLVKLHSKELEQFMNREEKRDEPSTAIFCNTTFLFDKHERIHPQFIWKLSSKVFELIPAQKATA